jgi:hypothetical protein
MRCIFCKNSSDNSTSVEHIIPESLGNVEHILPSGWVCDGCNNYFSREVEKPFLDSLYGKTSRFEMRIPNKKNRIPSIQGYHRESKSRIELFYSPDDVGLSIGAAEGEDESEWVRSVILNKTGTLYIPASNTPENNYVTARFIGKIGFEILAQRGIETSNWNNEIVNKKELDRPRNYVRFGNPKFVWPIHIRRIYPQDFQFADSESPSYQILHEWIILQTAQNEYYAVIAIFGIEYVINLGGPELEGYIKWLEDKNNKSPLYE